MCGVEVVGGSVGKGMGVRVSGWVKMVEACDGDGCKK